jgi:fermentation-respiration switch protein FrsA (DUF1100 family)
MFKVILYIVITFILLTVYIKYLENRGIFYPAKNIEATPDQINLSFEDIYIDTKDKFKINAWFIPNSNAKYTLIFCHGNAGNIGDRLDKIGLLHGLGMNIFIIDYRGFGRSQGKVSESGIYLDAKAAYDYLLNSRKIKCEHIILYGESIGSAVVIDLAAREKIGGLIVEGAFSKGRDMAKKIYPFLPAFLFSNIFDSLSKIKKVNASKLFIQSENDEIVPFALAKKLYDAAQEPKRLVKIIGGHNTAFLDSQPLFLAAVGSFMKELSMDAK